MLREIGFRLVVPACVEQARIICSGDSLLSLEVVYDPSASLYIVPAFAFWRLVNLDLGSELCVGVQIVVSLVKSHAVAERKLDLI